MQRKDIIWIAFLILIGMIAGWYLINKIDSEKNKVTMAGSVAMETFAEAISEMLEQWEVRVQPEFIGSSAGIEALLKEQVQVAMVSRYLTEDEKKQGIVENIVAYDGIVIIVNAENTVDNLSKEQLAKVFAGEIHNWKEIGGKDEAIIPIGRELGSGTRDSFEELVGIKGRSKYSNECDSIGVVKAKVELLSGAIGYVSLESVQDEKTDEKSKVKILAVEQIKPSITTIENREYLFVRPFILATLGATENQQKAVQKIFRILEKEQGVIIFERAGVAAAKNRKSQ